MFRCLGSFSRVGAHSASTGVDQGFKNLGCSLLQMFDVIGVCAPPFNYLPQASMGCFLGCPLAYRILVLSLTLYVCGSAT